jgi:hypothetical protein
MPERRLLRRIAWTALPLVAAAGLAVEVLAHLRPDPALEPWMELFSLSFEGNVPTWYATVLLFTCALLLLGRASRAERSRGRWAVLGAAVAYVSLDEAVGLHERLNDVVPRSGVFYYSWILPAAAIVIVLFLAYLPFLRELPADLRRRLLVAGAVYVTGALLLELPLGWVAERSGEESLAYALVDFTEETLELLGATLLLDALA